MLKEAVSGTLTKKATHSVHTNDQKLFPEHARIWYVQRKKYRDIYSSSHLANSILY